MYVRTGTVVDMNISADEFALAETLRSAPDAEFEASQFAATGSTCALPFLWARGAQFDRIEAALDGDPSVEGIEEYAEFETGRLYRVAWSERPRAVVRALVKRGGVLVGATCGGDRWEVRPLFRNREALSEAEALWRRTVRATVERVYGTERSQTRTPNGGDGRPAGGARGGAAKRVLRYPERGDYGGDSVGPRHLPAGAVGATSAGTPGARRGAARRGRRRRQQPHPAGRAAVASQRAAKTVSTRCPCGPAVPRRWGVSPSGRS